MRSKHFSLSILKCRRGLWRFKPMTSASRWTSTKLYRKFDIKTLTIRMVKFVIFISYIVFNDKMIHIKTWSWRWLYLQLNQNFFIIALNSVNQNSPSYGVYLFMLKSCFQSWPKIPTTTQFHTKLKAKSVLNKDFVCFWGG